MSDLLVGGGDMRRVEKCYIYLLKVLGDRSVYQ